MEAVFSSETSVEFHRTTHHYISKDGTLHIQLVFLWVEDLSFILIETNSIEQILLEKLVVTELVKKFHAF
jgi:hypothetical protein